MNDQKGYVIFLTTYIIMFNETYHSNEFDDLTTLNKLGSYVKICSIMVKRPRKDRLLVKHKIKITFTAF